MGSTHTPAAFPVFLLWLASVPWALLFWSPTVSNSWTHFILLVSTPLLRTKYICCFAALVICTSTFLQHLASKNLFVAFQQIFLSSSTLDYSLVLIRKLFPTSINSLQSLFMAQSLSTETEILNSSYCKICETCSRYIYLTFFSFYGWQYDPVMCWVLFLIICCIMPHTLFQALALPSPHGYNVLPRRDHVTYIQTHVLLFSSCSFSS